MANESMKLKVGVDVSSVKSDLKAAEQSVNDFGKSSTQIFQRIGSILGVNTSMIGRMTSAFKSSGSELEAAAKNGTKAMAETAAAMKGAAVAAGAFGLAAAAAIKGLSNDIKLYNKSISALSKNEGWDAYRQQLREARAQSASWLSEFVSAVKTKAVEASNYIRNLFSTPDAKAATEQQKKDARAIADETIKIENTEIAILEKKVESLRLDAEIHKRLDEMADSENSIFERLSQMQGLDALINSQYDSEISSLKVIAESWRKIVNIKRQNNTLTKEDLESLTSAEQAVMSLLNQKTSTQKAVNRGEKTVNREYGKWQINNLNELFADTSVEIDAIIAADLEELQRQGQELVDQVSEELKIPLEVQAIDVKRAYDMLAPLKDAYLNTFTEIGNFLGTVFSGNAEIGAEDLATGMLSVIGDLAIKFGTLAIAIGTTAEAIKESFFGLQGLAAIAAGSALVALGAAVKSFGSNIASGSYGSSSSYASASYSSNSNSNGDYTTKNLTVEVTGTLVASGSQLVAVLNNETNRRNHTT